MLAAGDGPPDPPAALGGVADLPGVPEPDVVAVHAGVSSCCGCSRRRSHCLERAAPDPHAAAGQPHLRGPGPAPPPAVERGPGHPQLRDDLLDGQQRIGCRGPVRPPGWRGRCCERCVSGGRCLSVRPDPPPLCSGRGVKPVSRSRHGAGGIAPAGGRAAARMRRRCEERMPVTMVRVPGGGRRRAPAAWPAPGRPGGRAGPAGLPPGTGSIHARLGAGCQVRQHAPVAQMGAASDGIRAGSEPEPGSVAATRPVGPPAGAGTRAARCAAVRGGRARSRGGFTRRPTRRGRHAVRGRWRGVRGRGR